MAISKDVEWKALLQTASEDIAYFKAELEKERKILRQILSLTKHRKVPVAQIHDLAIKALGGE